MTTMGRQIGPCYKCKSDMWLPEALYDAAKRSERITFWCPYGHEQHFVEGETEETKLRRERDRLVQRLAEKDDTIKRREQERDAALNQARAYKGAASKARQRGAAGVCQCCNRQFVNMLRHMKNKHPEFKAEMIA